MIRDSIDRVVAKRADKAVDIFEIDKSAAIDKIIVPYAPIVGQAADIVTTAIAIQRGYVESNPLMKPLIQSMPVFAVLKLGVGLGCAVIIKKLQDNGQHNAARVVSVVSTLAGAGPAINNLIVMNKQ